MNYILKLLLVAWWEITGNTTHLKPEYKAQQEANRQQKQTRHEQRIAEANRQHQLRQDAYIIEEARQQAIQDTKEWRY